MKKFFFELFLLFAAIGFVYLPAQAETPVRENNYGSVKTFAANANGQVRYVRYRGRLYRIRYRRVYRPRYRYYRYYRPRVRHRHYRYYRPRRHYVIYRY